MIAFIGTVPFIDADDPSPSKHSQTKTSPNGDPILTGPELLTYQEVAAIIASVVGYPVQHRRLTEEELACRLASAGMPTPDAGFLASLDKKITGGSEARLTEFHCLGR